MPAAIDGKINSQYAPAEGVRAGGHDCQQLWRWAWRDETVPNPRPYHAWYSTYHRSNQPLQITVSFDYLVNVVGDQIDLEGLRDNLVFRLGHDGAEIPFGERVLAALRERNFRGSYRGGVSVNRVGGGVISEWREDQKNFIDR